MKVTDSFNILHKQPLHSYYETAHAQCGFTTDFSFGHFFDEIAPQGPKRYF